MACKREQRHRRNTIAFWVSDEEKNLIEARIILSGLSKGEYYRRAILGQEVNVVVGNYMTERVIIALEHLMKEMPKNSCEDIHIIKELIQEIINIWKKEHALAGNKDMQE